MIEVDSENEFMLKFNSLRFILPKGTKHFWPYYGICFTGEYDHLLANIRASDYVLDAGANIGIFALLASRKAKKVIAVEPESPESYSYLVKNIEMNYTKNVIPINEALSDYCGDGYLSKKGIESTISPKNGTPVKVTTIDTLLKRLSLDKLDMIKMDIEGSEVKALKGKFIHNVRELVIETHGEKNHKDVKKMLQKENFSTQDWNFSWLTTFKKGVWNLKDFINSETEVKLWSTKQTLKYFLMVGEEPILKADPRFTQKIIIASRARA